MKFEYQGVEYWADTKNGHPDLEIDIYLLTKYVTTYYLTKEDTKRLASFYHEWQIKEWVISKSKEAIEDICHDKSSSEIDYEENLMRNTGLFIGLK